MPVRKKVVRRRKRKTTRRPRTNLMRAVKQIVMKNTETKQATLQYNTTAFNSGINGPGDQMQVLPPVGVGTSQYQRIGASIKPIKLVIRGFIQYKTDNNAGARMIGVRQFCYSDKTVSSYGTNTLAGSNFQLLDIGSSSQNFTGTSLNYNTPHNKDQFRFYSDRKHVIMKPYGLTNTLSPSATTELTSVDKSMYKSFIITIPASKMPANLKYDDTNSISQPVNFAPFLSVGYCDLLGYTGDTTNTQILTTWVSTLYYKDA